MLLWVDLHDKAYAWAENLIFSINTETGGLQVINVDEQTFPAESPKQKDSGVQLFDQYSDADRKTSSRGSQFFRDCPYRVFLRYFGIHTTTQRAACILVPYGLRSDYLLFIASCSVNSKRFTAGRLPYVPGIVKLRESPGSVGGLPRRNYRSCPPSPVPIKGRRGE